MTVALPLTATVAVIGAGTMGAGIAQIAALRGHGVQLHDTRFGAADAAKANIADALGKLVAKGKLAAADAEATLNRIATVVTLADACVVSLVVEAIAEDVTAKRDLFARLENVVTPECILASNTSSLSITTLGTGLEHPGRVVGMHFFNPVPLMPLVEVVSGLATDPGVAATIHATAAAWGKTPVHAASTPGFIVNRCARPFYGEALRLLAERAAEPATIDAVMRDAGGFRMGPFELMDLIGHDVNYAVTQSVWEAFFHDPRYTPSARQRELVAAGYLGRKSGRGFYAYGPGVAMPAPQTEEPGPRPARVVVHGDPGVAAPLVARLAAAGAAVDRCGRRMRASAGARCRCRAAPAMPGSCCRTAARRPRGRQQRACAIWSCSISRSTTRRRSDSPLRAPTAAPMPPARRLRARCRWPDSRSAGSTTARASSCCAPSPCSPTKPPRRWCKVWPMRRRWISQWRRG